MATYLNDLRLKEIATGDESGTWGTSSNTNLELIASSMGYGSEAVANASTHTITMADGAADEFRCTFLRLTGGGQACTVTLAPNTLSHTWIIRNTTSYALTFTQGSGANVIIAAGQAKIVTTDGLGSGAVVYECLEDLELGGTLTVGVDDTGQDVKFFGATSGRYWLWDESADGVVQQGTLTVGVDDTGYDVKFFGATSGSYMLWDESHNDLKLFGSSSLFAAGNVDFNGDLDVDGTTNLDVVDIDGAVQIDGTVTVGVDDTGLDVKFFGATSGSYMLWDESHNDLKLAGASSLFVAGGVDFDGNLDVDGTTNLDVVDIDGAVDMASTLGVTGVLTANAGVVVDNITIDGTEIDLSSGDLTIDVAGDIFLDAGGGTIRFKDDGTTIADISNNSSDLQIEAKVQDKDIKFLGDDGGSGITALTLDMSEAGAATFNNKVVATELDISGDIDIDGTSNLDVVDVDGAVNFAADVTYADGADIITASAGTSNFRAGVNAGNSIASGGNYNVCVGDEAGTALTTGDNNVAVGYQALDACTTTSNNIAVGHSAATALVDGAYNVAIGSNALATATDVNSNVAIGQSALKVCTGSSNTAIGYVALYSNTSAIDNVAVGVQALTANTTGTDNVAVGAYALDSNTVGYRNTAIGDNALGVDVDGASNTAVGAHSLAAMVDANYSTAIGDSALQNATGGSNTACGYAALNGVVAGIFNTGLGINAGNAITSGDNNLCLGRDAGIASSPGGAVTTGDNQICLGDENIANAHIQVDWTVASDERDKTDFTDLNLGLDFVKDLEPVTYKWDKRSKYTEKGDDLDTITHDGTHKEDWLDVGFKAQAVEALEKAAGYTISDKTNLITSLTEDGKQYGLQYSKFVPILVKAIQELSEKVKELESKSHTKCSK